MSLYGYSCVCVHIFIALHDEGVWKCALICVWGRRINTCTECFCLGQVREDGGTSIQTIRQLVIKRFKILGSQKGLSDPKYIP